MNQPAKRKPGCADEAWKVLICARDYSRAEDLLRGIEYILRPNDKVSQTAEDAAANLRTLTTDQIVDGLLASRDSALASVENAVGRPR